MADPRPSLHPADYTDSLVFGAEIDRVMADEWIPLCRVDQVAEAGDWMAVTLCGRPLVAVRGPDGVVRVLGNVCPHRGSTIVEPGVGNATALVCPYHRWAFRLDGTFVGGPLSGDVGEGTCLPVVRHVVWQGFVLVNLSGGAPDPTVTLETLGRHIEPWGWSEMVVVASAEFASCWNWKVMVENWIECYHHIGAHREVLEPFFPARNTRVVDSGGAPWVAMDVKGVEGVEGDPGTRMPGVSEREAPLLSVWAAFPLLLGGSVAGHGFWLQILPGDVASHTVRMHLLFHRDRLAGLGEEEIAGHMATLRAVHEEDMVTCAAVQAGLASGLLDTFHLAPLEAPIAAFQTWVAERLGTAP